MSILPAKMRDFAQSRNITAQNHAVTALYLISFPIFFRRYLKMFLDKSGNILYNSILIRDFPKMPYNRKEQNLW